MNIPVAHVQGGEITGSIDESIRHAASKFSHIHFPATKDAALRLIKMGEDKKFIFTVGCPSIDALVQAPKMSKEEISKILKLDHKKPYALVVQHPVTTELKKSGFQIKQTIEAVKELALQAVVLYPNNDAGTKKIVSFIKKSNMNYIKSLPSEVYANVLHNCSVLVGNSSSGIHEAATFHVPVVNIGTRQQGRQRPKNVIDVACKKEDIKKAIKKALYDKNFKKIILKAKNPYGDGHSSERIVKILKNIDIKKIPLQKQFKD